MSLLQCPLDSLVVLPSLLSLLILQCSAWLKSMTRPQFSSPRPNFWNSQLTQQHGLSLRSLEDGRGWPSLCQADETVSELGTKSCAEGHLPVPSGLFISLIDCFVVCCQALECAGSAHGRMGRSGRAVQLQAWCARPRGLLLDSAARFAPGGK